jgi:hypothetical protein
MHTLEIYITIIPYLTWNMLYTIYFLASTQVHGARKIKSVIFKGMKMSVTVFWMNVDMIHSSKILVTTYRSAQKP